MLEELGIDEWVVCPGGRNTPIIRALQDKKLYFWSEERSAAFFALGRARATGKPVPVVVTSGTAAGELLPATMEAYYTQTPLILVTADRPKRFRGSGAPQAAEQKNLFGVYATAYDVDWGEQTKIEWDRKGPLHLNICLEDPNRQGKVYQIDDDPTPLVIVSTLSPSWREQVVQYLLDLNAPTYLEAVSGLREDPRLAHLRAYHPRLKKRIIRIGGVPTHSIWRDIEEADVDVESFSETPFPGLSWGTCRPLDDLCATERFEACAEAPILIFDEEPLSEPALIHQLSKRIPAGSLVYLGNSLPIREWDLAATFEPKNFDIQASRGLNGIDGQISTFLGLCKPDVENWGIFGDLTTLYDLVAPWILSQMKDYKIRIVIINNSGGKIFADPLIQNQHSHSFEHWAQFWNLTYQTEYAQHCLIELVPDNASTARFWEKLEELLKRLSVRGSDGILFPKGIEPLSALRLTSFANESTEKASQSSH